MPVAAFMVHQLRYYLAYGAGWQAELARTGHSYLHSVVPWLVALAALTLGGFLWRLGQALSGQRSLPRYSVSLLGLWLVSAAGLLAIFVVQETLEGFLATGHPAGLAAAFAYGGWWAIPVSLCVGLVLATLFHGGLWVLDETARRRARAPRSAARRAGKAIRPFATVFPVLLAPLAAGWSRRGPPE